MGEIFHIKKVKKGITNLNNNNCKGDNKNQRKKFKFFLNNFLIISRNN